MEKGAAELISFVLATAIILAGIGTVLIVGNPLVDRSKSAATVAESESILKTIDRTLSDVVYERKGSTRVVDVRVSNGEYRIDSEDDYIEFFMEAEDRFIEPTAQTKNGNLYKAGRRGVETYTTTVNGEDVLMMENDHTYFAIKWVNETTPLSEYNTSNMILLLGNKDNNYNQTFDDSSIYIDGLSGTNTGKGWSEITNEGRLQGVGEGAVHFESDEGTNYTITFRLRSGADYVTMEVTDIEGGSNNITGTLDFEIDDSSADTISEGNNFVSADNGSIIGGLVDDDTSLDTSSTRLSNSYQLNMTQDLTGNEFYYLMSDGDNTTITDSDIEDIDDYSGAFGFSYPREEEYYSWLYYDNVDIVSDLRFGEGEHELILKNEGTSNNKVQLNISLK